MKRRQEVYILCKKTELKLTEIHDGKKIDNQKMILNMNIAKDIVGSKEIDTLI